jgi:hypothetical protein
MIQRVAADVIVLLHLAFIMFVVFGGVLALKWRRVMWLHIPAAIWGALIEMAGWICPLTPIENSLRIAGGAPSYSGGFIEHYIVPIVYPTGLTRAMQLSLAALVILINVVVYAFLLRQKLRRRVMSKPGHIQPPTRQ